MKASLQLNMSQSLTLTPQLQQAIRLLQLSTMELSQEVQQLIESNPMLELEESTPVVSGESLTFREGETQWQDSSPRSPRSSSAEDLPDYENYYTAPVSLQDHLTWQMELTPFSELDRAIATAIIDTINDDGFLTSDLSDIEATVTVPDGHAPPGLDEIEAVLHRIQRFDPIGCGSRNLTECLLLQLNELPPETPWRSQSEHIIRQHIDWLGQHNYRDLMRKTKLAEHELAEVLKLIHSLHPKPGSIIDDVKPDYIVPDVLVGKQNGRWLVELNPESVPRLRINANYAALARQVGNKADSEFLKNNLQEARWFVKSLQSRNETLLRVATRIVHYQKGFLERGEEAMKPLVLHVIAEDLGLHESTISRVTTQKFMHTPRGVFELKYFFSSHVNTSSGGECSSTAIRALVKKLIASENPRKPLSDNEMAKLIGAEGIQVARRTIAKYRESLGIPPSNERKSLLR